MAKIKLTKGELKKQRDALHQYERYLPTLQLKKQQLQIEIVHQYAMLQEKVRMMESKKNAVDPWLGLLNEAPADFKTWIVPSQIVLSGRNIAGVDIPVCQDVQFGQASYDLFSAPFWVDEAVDALRFIVALREELAVLKKGIAILKQELRVTAQRVNLFEKVKIPETKDAIRLIKIYIGDQLANAVGRSKIAKGKIEAGDALELAAV